MGDSYENINCCYSSDPLMAESVPAHKSIKDITFKDSLFKLQFEVIKRLSEEEEGTIFQISDETGTAKFFFGNEVKKHVLEGKVYVATNVQPLLRGQRVILELNKLTGSLTKEPFILPFKDHTFDLSEKEWETEDHTKKSILSQKESTTSTVLEVKPPVEKKDLANKRDQLMTSTNLKHEHAFDPPKNKPKYVEKVQVSDREEKVQKDIRVVHQTKQSKPQIQKLIKISQYPTPKFISIEAEVSGIRVFQKYLNGVWREFQECILADNTGMVIGCFYPKTRLEEKQVYQIQSLKVRSFGVDKIELLENQHTSIRVMDVRLKPKKEWVSYD